MPTATKQSPPLRPGQLLPRASSRRARTRADVQPRAGRTLSDIGRVYGASHSTVPRAVRSLSVTELSALVIGREQSCELLFPAPDLDSPIDIQQEAISIGENLRALRAWLTSDEAKEVDPENRFKTALETPQRASFVIPSVPTVATCRLIEW